MTARPDDDALSWAGDDDPTLNAGATRPDPATPAGLPAGYRAVGRGSRDIAPPEESPAGTATDGPAPLGNVALVGFGILGGVYLLFTIGWIIGGGRMLDAAVFLVAPAAVAPAVVLAAAGPALWFGITMLLTRRRAIWLRFVWLVAGALLLVPWPFVMVGAVN